MFGKGIYFADMVTPKLDFFFKMNMTCFNLWHSFYEYDWIRWANQPTTAQPARGTTLVFSSSVMLHWATCMSETRYIEIGIRCWHPCFHGWYDSPVIGRVCGEAWPWPPLHQRNWQDWTGSCWHEGARWLQGENRVMGQVAGSGTTIMLRCLLDLVWRTAAGKLTCYTMSTLSTMSPRYILIAYVLTRRTWNFTPPLNPVNKIGHICIVSLSPFFVPIILWQSKSLQVQAKYLLQMKFNYKT